jgi:DNA invertase Pin-like site-specific DNA recombinase
MMKDLKITSYFIEEGVSASIPLAERPMGKLLLSDLKPGDIIITPKLDRMFRSSLDALTIFNQLQAQSIQLHMLDLGGDVLSNGMSKLMFTIVSAFAEAERDRIRERVRDIKKDQRSRNRYLGGKTPYGYKVNLCGELVENPWEQDTIKVIKEARKRGHTIRRIAQVTNLSLASVHKILKRP